MFQNPPCYRRYFVKLVKEVHVNWYHPVVFCVQQQPLLDSCFHVAVGRQANAGSRDSAPLESILVSRHDCVPEVVVASNAVHHVPHRLYVVVRAVENRMDQRHKDDAQGLVGGNLRELAAGELLLSMSRRGCWWWLMRWHERRSLAY